MAKEKYEENYVAKETQEEMLATLTNHISERKVEKGS